MYNKILHLSFLAFIMLLLGCDVSDDGKLETSVIAPIVTANIPETMEPGETYTLEITYSKESNCHNFLNFDRQTIDNTVFMSGIARYNHESDCSDESVNVTKEVEFENTFDGDFDFKFVSGFDENNSAQYITYDVEVTE